MGMLTDDMTRLGGEIGVLRRERETLRKDLAQGSRGRARAVSEMRTGFFHAHSEMARKMKAELRAFTTNLRREVGGQRQEFRADLAGAQRAWNGKKAFRAGR